MCFEVEILGISELNDGVFEGGCTFLVRVGTGYAVSAVDLCVNEICFNVDVLLYVLDRFFVVGLSEVVGLDESAFYRGVGVGICAESGGLCDLTAAGLIFESLFVSAVVNDLVSLRLCK